MKIGLIGWYGHGNAGDERILYCLKRFFDGHEFFVTSSFANAAKHIEQLNGCDYVLLGGGGLILRGLNTYTELVEKIKPALGCVGLGVEACHDDNATFIEVLKEKSEFILVRDEQSRELLDNHFKVIVSSDLTFLYPFDVVEPVKSDTCGVNLRDWYFWKCEHGGKYYKHMMAMLQSNPEIEKDYPHPKWEPDKAFDIIRRRFSNLVPAPLYFGGNSKSDHILLSTFFDKVDEAISLPDVYRSCRYFVGMRVHSLVFACQMGIPFVSLSYQPKNERFCKTLGLKELSVDLFNIRELDNAIMIMKDSYSQLRERLLSWRESAHSDICSTMSNIRKLIVGSSVGCGIDLKRQATAGTDKSRSLRAEPRVSVVLPTYNHMQFLPKAIDSVLSQTYGDFELIIVNDGSTDGTAEYLDILKDLRIRIIHQENKRLPEALNTGFRAVRGEYLTWISADNYCAPTFLKAFVAALDANPDVGFAYSAYACIDKNDQIFGKRVNMNVSFYSLLTHNDGTPSFMYRRACQEKVGLYDSELEGAEDWDMWLRIIEQFQTVYVPEILYYYRYHKNSMTKKIPEEIHQACQRVSQKALNRHDNELNIMKLYPTLALCKDQRKAKFNACFDFGTAFLKWQFAPAEFACQMLEYALAFSSNSMEATCNLALAYARLGLWEKSIPLLDTAKKKFEDSRVRNLYSTITESRETNNPDMLTNGHLFEIDKRTVTLFQLEEKNKCVFSFTNSCE